MEEFEFTQYTPITTQSIDIMSVQDQEPLLLGRKKDKTITGSENATEYVDMVISSIGFGLFQVIAFILTEMTCLAAVCEAMTFSFVSIEVTKHWNISSLVYSTVPAATSIANIVGVLVFGYWAERWGRKWPYTISLFMIAVFVAGSAFSPTFAVFGVLRNIASIGTGATTVIKIPMLMEFLPVKYRGVVSTTTGLLEGFGKCAVAGLAWWIVPKYSNGWRYFVLASTIPSFVTAIAFAFFVESPRYLVTHNRAEQAWKVFSVIASVNGKQLENIVRKEDFICNVSRLHELQKNSEMTQHSFHKFFYIFNRHYIRRTLCFCAVYPLPIAVAYTTTLFLPQYLTSMQMDPYFITLIGLASEIPGRALIPIIVEWPEFGRRNTLRMFFLMSIIFFLLFAFVRNEIATPVLIVLVYFSFVPTAGLITTFVSESYPTEIRISAVGFFQILDGINEAWLPFVSGYATDLAHEYAWLSPTCSSAIMTVPFVAALLLKHDTRGKRLEDFISVS